MEEEDLAEEFNSLRDHKDYQKIYLMVNTPLSHEALCLREKAILLMK